jgi:hypothetical protein
MAKVQEITLDALDIKQLQDAWLISEDEANEIKDLDTSAMDKQFEEDLKLWKISELDDDTEELDGKEKWLKKMPVDRENDKRRVWKW